VAKFLQNAKNRKVKSLFNEKKNSWIILKNSDMWQNEREAWLMTISATSKKCDQISA